MTRRRLVGPALCAAAALAVGQYGTGQPARERTAKSGPDVVAPDGKGEGKRAAAFVAAFQAGDAKAVAAFWTPDGDYVDQAGKHTKGRAAIETLYAGVFAANKGAKLAVTVTAARPVGTDVLLEDGITEVTPADGGPGTAARFSAVLVKTGGEWYFESLRESVALPPSHAEHFGDLAGLVGDWAGADAKGESGTASYAWAENRNFLVSSFATTLNGTPVVGGTQWIGYDAAEKRVRSWSFYSGGGFGEAAWTKAGARWVSTVTATTADGKKVTATNTLTRTDADNITWQLSRLTVDGRPQPDPKPLALRRVKP